MVSQRQIAEKLGVSINTVSRALRNHPDLSEETKGRIRQTAAELGYGRLSRMPAHGLNVERVGILFFCQDNTNLLDSEIYRQIFMAIEQEFQRAHVETVCQFPEKGETPLCVKNRTVDGLLLFGRYTEESVRFAKDFPTLSISSHPCKSGIPRISTDNAGGIASLTEYLIELGHRHILFFGPASRPFTQMYRDRANGYLTAMTRHGLTPELQESAHENENLRIAPLPEDCTAVVGASDAFALSMMHHLAEQDPERLARLSITGFDNLQESEQEGLTTFAPNWNTMGILAAHFLIHRPEILTQNFNVVVPGRILHRSSTHPAPTA